MFLLSMTLTVALYLYCNSLRMMVAILYQVINNEQDRLILQNDLDLILKWTEIWQNASKCAVITCSRLLSTTISNYTIGGNNLHRVNQHHYLGILFDLKMSFSPHISNTIKVPRTPNFIKRKLCKCSSPNQKFNLVRLLLEYGAAVWDPIYRKTYVILKWYNDMLPAG